MSFFLHGDFVVFGDIANIATFTSANFPLYLTPTYYAYFALGVLCPRVPRAGWHLSIFLAGCYPATNSPIRLISETTVGDSWILVGGSLVVSLPFLYLI
jgi:hypothetical protein